MPIQAKFEADFTQFRDQVAAATGSLQGMEATSKTVGPAIAAHLAGAEIRRFATEVTGVAKEFIGAFAEEQAAVSRLTTAMKAHGDFTPELLKRYADLGAEFQRTTRFSDDAIASTQAMLVQVGGVMPGQMQQALTAITNLAAGMGPQVGGLEGATLLVAKAFAGGGEHLGKLKILLGDAVQPGADMAEVLDAINKKFGGQAAADRATAIGQYAALNNQMSDFKERIGELLLTGLTPLANAFAQLPESAQTFLVGAAVIGTALAPLAVTFASVVTSLNVLVPLLSVGFVAAVSAVAAPIAVVTATVVGLYLVFKNWSTIVDFARGVYEGVKLWLVDKFNDLVVWIGDKVGAVTGIFKGMYDKVVGHSIVPDMISGIREEFSKLGTAMEVPAQKTTAAVTGMFFDMQTQSLRSVRALVAGTSDFVIAGQEGLSAYLHGVSGFRAAGGPVTSGSAYVVGERGPEVFVPESAGQILAAGAGGGGRTIINIPITINGSVLSSPTEIARVIGAAVMQSLRGAGVRVPSGA